MESICHTPLAQENYNTLMAGIQQDNQIVQNNQAYLQELQAQED